MSVASLHQAEISVVAAMSQHQRQCIFSIPKNGEKPFTKSSFKKSAAPTHFERCGSSVETDQPGRKWCRNHKTASRHWMGTGAGQRAEKIISLASEEERQREWSKWHSEYRDGYNFNRLNMIVELRITGASGYNAHLINDHVFCRTEETFNDMPVFETNTNPGLCICWYAAEHEPRWMLQPTESKGQNVGYTWTADKQLLDAVTWQVGIGEDWHTQTLKIVYVESNKSHEGVTVSSHHAYTIRCGTIRCGTD